MQKLTGRKPGRALYTLAILLLAMGWASCSKMDATYRDYWEEGEHIYPGSPDSVKVYSGKNRIKLAWLIIGSASVNRTRIFWNNGKDSAEVAVEHKDGSLVDSVSVLLDNMQEGSYSFQLFALDDKGNSSVGVNVVGSVYGDNYIHSLLIRLEKAADFIDDTLKITWGDPVNGTSTGSEILYRDTTGVTRIQSIAPDAAVSAISDYDYDANDGSFTYRTLYRPQAEAIDTFYTDYETVKVDR